MRKNARSQSKFLSKIVVLNIFELASAITIRKVFEQTKASANAQGNYFMYEAEHDAEYKMAGETAVETLVYFLEKQDVSVTDEVNQQRNAICHAFFETLMGNYIWQKDAFKLCCYVQSKPKSGENYQLILETRIYFLR